MSIINNSRKTNKDEHLSCIKIENCKKMCIVLCVYQSPQQQQQQHSIWKCNSAFPKVVTDVHPFFFFISSSYSEKQHLSRMIFFSRQKKSWQGRKRTRHLPFRKVSRRNHLQTNTQKRKTRHIKDENKKRRETERDSKETCDQQFGAGDSKQSNLVLHERPFCNCPP